MKRLSFPSTPMPPWRWLRHVLLWSSLALGGIGLAVFLLDPFLAYHRPFFGLKPVYDDAYQMIPGLVRHADFDSVVVGSSMCQNFQLPQLRRALGGTWLKLTPSGCTPATMRTILGLVFQEHPVRHVLAGVDIFTFTRGVEEHRVELPGYLYDRSPWNDYRYLWNRTVLAEHLPDLLKANFSQKAKYRRKLDADRMWSWDFEDGTRRYGWAAVLAAEREQAADAAGAQSARQATLAAMRANFEFNLLEPIRRNPAATFVLFFPPYSLLAWEKHQETGDLALFLQFKQEIQERLLQEPNVRMYDFQADEAIVGNYDNYKDSTHYSPAISRFIVEAIAQDRHRVGPGGPAANRRELLELLARRGPPPGAVTGPPPGGSPPRHTAPRSDPPLPPK
ncbi:MAG: hypothetical protein WC789_00795 [Lentisphaeria bacterium]|jgi:hypothetical protein